MANNTKIRTIDESVFSNYGEDAEYWCGILATDGNISFCRTSTVPCVCYSSKDVEHVVKFRSFLKADYVISFRDKLGTFGQNKLAMLRFTSREIGELLICNGITPKKSLTLVVSERLTKSRHFWRGVIDGDGSIGIYGKYLNPVISLSSGSFQFIKQFAEFCSNAGLRPKISSCEIKDFSVTPHYRVAFGSSQARQLISILYADVVVALDRKKVIAEKIFAQPVRHRYERQQSVILGVRVGANVVQ